jgi:hypothetical protein
MKKILAIALKDNLVRFSSKSEWLFFLILPVIFSIVINMATGSQNDSRISLLVVDQDGGELARDLVAVLEDSKTVAVKEYSFAEAESKFRDRQAPAMLVIPAGLGKTEESGEIVELQFTEAAGNVDAVAARQAVQAALGSLGRALQVAGVSVTAAEEIRPFADSAEREAYFQDAKQKAETLFAENPERIYITGPAGAGTQTDFWSPSAQASAGTVITWVFIPLLGISEFFATERRMGTLRRLLSAPVSKAVYLLGTIVGQLGTALVQMFILAGFVDDVPCVRIGIGCFRDDAGHFRENPGASVGIERRIRNVDGAPGRLLVPARAVPRRSSKNSAGPTHDLGDDRYERYRAAWPRVGGGPAGSSCSVGFCGSVFYRGCVAVPIRVALYGPPIFYWKWGDYALRGRDYLYATPYVPAAILLHPLAYRNLRYPPDAPMRVRRSGTQPCTHRIPRNGFFPHAPFHLP